MTEEALRRRSTDDGSHTVVSRRLVVTLISGVFAFLGYNGYDRHSERLETDRQQQLSTQEIEMLRADRDKQEALEHECQKEVTREQDRATDLGFHLIKGQP